MLRRLSYYREIERNSERGDEMEGAVRGTLQVEGYDALGDEPDPLLLKVGVSAKRSKNLTINASLTTRVRDDYFVLCASLIEADHLKSEGWNALVRIRGIVEFASAIARSHSDRIGSFWVGPVQYQERDFDVRLATLVPDPCVKRERYSIEREVRFLWTAPSEPDTLLTDCPEAGALVERIR